MGDDTTFYMVWVEGSRGGMRMHPTRQSADEEAVGLARREGQAVYILKAITCIEIAESPIKQTELKAESEVRTTWASSPNGS